ncbi:MAG: MATE family efflux transporter [Acidaminococcaceae bacterium]
MIFTATTQLKLKNILTVMIPIFITQLAVIGMNFFDTVMSGQAGANDLAGVAIGSNLWMPIFTGLNGILIALTPILAHHLGAARHQDITQAVKHGLLLSLIIGLAVIGGGFFFLEDVLAIMHLEPEVHRIATHYLGALALGIIPFFACSTLRCFVDTLGYTQLTMRIFLLTLPLNVVLNYMMIFGKWGFPHLGGVGAGYATALTYWLVFGIFLFAIQKVAKLHQYFFFGSGRLWNFHWLPLVEQLRIGLPIGISIFFETSIFGIIALFMAKFGTITIAAHQAAINFTSLLYMLPLSFSMALTIVIGVEVGAKRYREAISYSRIGICADLAVAVFFVLLLLFARTPVARLYSTEPAIMTMVVQFLFYAAFFQLLDGIATPIQGILRGYKDVKVSFYASLFAYWGICLPLGYYLDAYCQQGPFSYWQSLILGIFCSASFLFLRLVRIQRKFRDQEQGAN